MKLYRAISKNEMNDFELYGQFQTSKNTLEAKQFFKSKTAVLSFVTESRKQEFDPPYTYLLTIDIDEDYLNSPNIINLNLDGFDAVSIEENGLLDQLLY
ncbi:hypothetical protein EON73_03755 [bacterium]|nr:MAG: hypothetical protein EON73_03755 [bacterium]